MDALAFIEKDGHTRRQPYYVVSGDEDFLKRRVVALLGPIVLGDADPQFATTVYPGETTDFSTVRNELDSVSFFSDRRLVIVEQADKFVTNFRPELEKYVTAPSSVGVLVLEVNSFPLNTKLAKAVPEACHLICKAPKENLLPKWCARWCETQYGKKLTNQAAELLVTLVGAAMGVLDQELQKLKDFIGERGTIDVKEVDELVGKNHGADVFKIMKAIGNGQPDQAIRILQEVLDAGEPVLKIVAALNFQLKRLAKIGRLNKQGMPLGDAYEKVGVNQYFREETGNQLRHLGRNRLDQLYDWMIEIDSGLKGGSQLPERVQLERLIVRLARPRV